MQNKISELLINQSQNAKIVDLLLKRKQFTYITITSEQFLEAFLFCKISWKQLYFQ